MELRDTMPKFEEAGIKLYAISYDDPEALAAFAAPYGIGYPLLSDVDSEVIRRYGILNTEICPGDLPAYGVPFRQLRHRRERPAGLFPRTVASVRDE